MQLFVGCLTKHFALYKLWRRIVEFLLMGSWKWYGSEFLIQHLLQRMKESHG
jgi:hypothetical protein